MTFIEVTYRHRLSEDAQRAFAQALREGAEKFLHTGEAYSTQVKFAGGATDGPNVMFAKVEIFADMPQYLLTERVGQNFLGFLTKFFKENKMPTPEIFCTAEWRNNYKFFWSTMDDV